ncbi:helix-turn-helix domain-containing protein [Acinetobacter baumannii]|uniref:helix-turn-helix domain-containing protein n=1 Tax=Acinetobacter baumannii TaxID=470 RepID=UPI0009C9E5F9|nr:helix-turn-helix domain-containing protein [Acinetobacter baumannii]SMB76781.1 putative zinc finger/helix-turn-helix protein, YgiT family [Acinetobacter baumannii]
MAKLNDIISKRSPESQQRIKKMANQMLLDINLSNLREELKISQAEIAKNLGVSQAAISKREKLGLLDYRFKLRASQSKSVILTRRPKK